MPSYPWDSSPPQPHHQPPPPQQQHQPRTPNTGTTPLTSNPQPSRRHRTRLYARRIRESLQTRFCMFICSVFLSLLFVASLIIFILWLSLRPHRPRFHVTSFNAPSAAQAFSGSVPDYDIAFSVSDRNPNRNIGIYYDAMEGSLFYRDQRIGQTPLLMPFYQPPKNTTMIAGTFVGSAMKLNQDMEARLRADAETGRVGFRLELAGRIRFRVTMWDTHQHGLHVSCDVVVGPDGAVLQESKDQRCSIYF